MGLLTTVIFTVPAGGAAGAVGDDVGERLGAEKSLGRRVDHAVAGPGDRAALVACSLEALDLQRVGVRVTVVGEHGDGDARSRGDRALVQHGDRRRVLDRDGDFRCRAATEAVGDRVVEGVGALEARRRGVRQLGAVDDDGAVLPDSVAPVIFSGSPLASLSLPRTAMFTALPVSVPSRCRSPRSGRR